jgi:phosphohistidine swiveling domain-containing protein
MTNNFKEILDNLFMLTARPNSIQRGTIFGAHFLNNKFNPISLLLFVPVSSTDVEWYMDRESADKLLETEATEFFQPGFLREYIKRDETGYKEMISVYEKVNKDFLKKEIVIDDRIIKSVKELYDYSKTDNTYFYFGLVVWAFDQKVLPKFRDTLQSYSKEDFDNVWHIITAQTELSMEQQFRINLAKLKSEYGDKIDPAELSKMQTKNRYLGIYCPEDHGYDYDDILRNYQELDIEKVSHLVKEIEENKDKFNLLLEKHRNEEKICEIFSIINYNVYFRNLRSERMSIGFALLTPFYDYLIKALQFSRKEVGNLTKDEIIKFLERGEIPPKRNQYLGILYTNDEIRELTAEERKLFDEKYRQKIIVDQFQGNIAYKGVVKGRVKIILSNGDLSKVNEGDILVSQFTRPEYLSAMKKAAAIVTNDGGITCHAAIVARELKKPCIIGTKIATKALKDGDLVEVDADNGIVRIIK